MKNAFRLLITGLLLGFIFGCSGGDDDSASPDINFALLWNSFPATTNGLLKKMTVNKEYAVSSKEIEDFNATILDSYDYLGNGVYEKTDVLPNVDASVTLDSDTIDLYLNGTANINLDSDETFNMVFGDINGRVIYIIAERVYSVPQSFGPYSLKLRDRDYGFSCGTNNSGEMQCEKTANGLVYIWKVVNSVTEQFHIYINMAIFN
ncbi:MAG: hypothetical protein LBL65_06040 [Campylobacteraceae bacterium]|jgi:hypothetical protein|nr:hypothetical protein [Campylobacteraceae bacterium]